MKKKIMVTAVVILLLAAMFVSCKGGVGGYGIRRCDNGTWVEAAVCSCTVSVGDLRKPPYGTSCKVYSNYVTCDYARTWCVSCVNGKDCMFN